MEGHWKFQGGGGLKSQNVLRKVSGLTGISGGVGGFKPKSLPWEGYGRFLEQHNRPIRAICCHSNIFQVWDEVMFLLQLFCDYEVKQ